MEIIAKCPFCGGNGRKAKPYSTYTQYKGQRYIYCVECTVCGEHSQHGRTWDEAIHNWNGGLFSDETWMLQNELTPETMNTEGALRAVLALMDDNYKEYHDTLKDLILKRYLSAAQPSAEKRRLEDAADRCERYYRYSPFMDFAGADADAVILHIQKEVLDEIEKGGKK